MAKLILHTDIDCKVYIDTEYYGTTSANADCEFVLGVGAYWVEVVAEDYSEISYDFDYRVHYDSDEKSMNISMLSTARYNNLKSQYDYIGEFAFGLAEVRKDDKIIGYVDTSYQFKYSEVCQLSNSLMRVRVNDKYGVIGVDGKELLPAKYEEIFPLNNGLLEVKLNSRYGIVGTDGIKKTPLKYRAIESCGKGIYAVFFNKWEFIDGIGNYTNAPNNVIIYKEKEGVSDDGTGGIFHYDVNGCQIGSSNYNCINGQTIIIYSSICNEIDEITDFSAQNWHNESLLEVILPNSLTYIAPKTFSGCSSLKSISIPNGVIEIGYEAFAGCSSLSSITLPSNLSIVEGGLFEDCTSLKSVVIPKCITRIDKQAFKGCSSLVDISIPDGVTGIGGHAFEDCVMLRSITLPESLAVIGSCVFKGCSSLNYFYGKYSSEDNRCLICSYTGLVGENIKELMSFAPYGLEEYNIPNGVTTIGSYAFYNCTSLVSVTLPNSIRDVRDGAFSGCESLSAFYGKLVSNDNRCIIKVWGGKNILSCFASAGLTNYTIPEGVDSIGSRAFERCSSLISISLSDDVKDIYKSAFCACFNLQTITIGKGLKFIDESAFYDCTSLSKINLPNVGKYYEFKIGIPDDNEWIYDDEGRGVGIRCSESDVILSIVNKIYIGDKLASYTPKETIIIPNGVQEIAERKFCDCSNIRNVIIPEGVVKIGKYAFRNCVNLEKVTLPTSLQIIDECAFIGCKALNDIEIPKGVVEIGEYAFANCESLESLEIPKGIRSLESHLCSGCKSLKNVVIPEGVYSIRGGAFHDCISLKNIIIPYGVKRICSDNDYDYDDIVGAFKGCSSLTSVTIPDSVEEIDGGTFCGCSLLSAFYGKYASVDNRCLIQNECYCDWDGIVHYRMSLLSFAPYGLIKYTTPEGVENIGDGAFSECDSLEIINISNGVTRIGNLAFANCNNLVSVSIPDSVDCIEKYAFANCASLENVDIREHQISIEEDSFEECPKLTERSIYLIERIRNLKG